MRKIGWAYLVLCAFDGALSVGASFVSDWVTYSNLVSTVVILASVVVVVLAAINRLRPRPLFLVVSILYLCIAVLVGMALGVLLTAKLGLQGVPANPTPELLAQHFAWYWPVHWASVISLLVVALVGMVIFMQSKDIAEPGHPGDTAKPRP